MGQTRQRDGANETKRHVSYLFQHGSRYGAMQRDKARHSKLRVTYALMVALLCILATIGSENDAEV
jgi:hypothetical protein